MKLFPFVAQQIIRTTLLALAAVSVPFLDSCQDSKQTLEAKAKQEIKYSADPNATKNMTLLLKDFDPKPMLHAAVHETPRAKYPVIDEHNHVNDPGGVHGEEIPVAEVVRRMDAANVQKIVILTGMWGDKLQSVLEKMVKPYPDRFVVFAQYDWSRIDDPNFFPYWGHPGQGRWEIYGMELPDSVLEKVYHKNADKIFSQFKERP